MRLTSEYATGRVAAVGYGSGSGAAHGSWIANGDGIGQRDVGQIPYLLFHTLPPPVGCQNAAPWAPSFCPKRRARDHRRDERLGSQIVFRRRGKQEWRGWISVLGLPGADAGA